MHVKPITKLVFELEISVFLDMLELHAFEHIIVLLHVELSFKTLSDKLKALGLELFSCCRKLVTVVLVKQHVKSLEC